MSLLLISVNYLNIVDYNHTLIKGRPKIIFKKKDIYIYI